MGEARTRAALPAPLRSLRRAERSAPRRRAALKYRPARCGARPAALPLAAPRRTPRPDWLRRRAAPPPRPVRPRCSAYILFHPTMPRGRRGAGRGGAGLCRAGGRGLEGPIRGVLSPAPGGAEGPLWSPRGVLPPAVSPSTPTPPAPAAHVSRVPHRAQPRSWPRSTTLVPPLPAHFLGFFPNLHRQRALGTHHGHQHRVPWWSLPFHGVSKPALPAPAPFQVPI